MAYTQINRVLTLLHLWAEDGGSKNDSGSGSESRSENELKLDFSDRIGEVEAKIVQFLSNSPDSDVKSISKAIGLRSSRTTDYIKRLLEDGQIESSDGWRKTYRLKK